MSFGTQQSQGKSFTSEQNALLKQTMNAYSPSIGQGQESYQGDRVAPLTGTQQMGINQGAGFLDQFSPYRNMPLFGETGDALSGILSGKTGAAYITPEATQNYYKTTIEDPARYEFAKNTAPAIAEQYSGPGYWSSARAKAGATANQELGNWLGTQRGELDWKTQEANRAIDEAKANRALAGTSLGMQYSQLPTTEALNRLQGTSGVLSNIGGLEQGQQQQLINADMQRFLESNRITDPEDIQIILSLLGMNYSSNSSSGFNFGLSGLGIGGSTTTGADGGVSSTRNWSI